MHTQGTPVPIKFTSAAFGLPTGSLGEHHKKLVLKTQMKRFHKYQTRFHPDNFIKVSADVNARLP